MSTRLNWLDLCLHESFANAQLMHPTSWNSIHQYLNLKYTESPCRDSTSTSTNISTSNHDFKTQQSRSSATPKVINTSLSNIQQHLPTKIARQTTIRLSTQQQQWSLQRPRWWSKSILSSSKTTNGRSRIHSSLRTNRLEFHKPISPRNGQYISRSQPRSSRCLRWNHCIRICSQPDDHRSLLGLAFRSHR